MLKQALEDLKKKVSEFSPFSSYGKVIDVVGLSIEAYTPGAFVGELCEIITPSGNSIWAEVVGFKEGKTILMPIGDLIGVGPGSLVRTTGKPVSVKVSDALLGRVVDGLGRPLDEYGEIYGETRLIYAYPPHPLKRKPIEEPLETGVRAIDGLITIGKGQRIGLFAGSGVGKSTLMGMIARNSLAEVNVIALIGERGREVKDFIYKSLGEEGLKKSVLVVATSDQPAVVRVRAAFTAFTIAEYFRDKGEDVLLMMDSVTRFAMAQREIGLSAGEPPTTRGYTPSVFGLLPRLLERGGASERGSITVISTVLVEGDDMNEPVADTVRSIIDGHIVLSRKLAHRSHYPAIDVLQSVSRVMPDVVTREHMELAMKIREILAIYRDAEDLINIGAYSMGTNPKIDYALNKIDQINEFLRQDIYEKTSLPETIEWMKRILSDEEV
ncbi:flagellar protein export ATPase FliI [bacterium 3DAC]|jgi:flagellum-specific ATP synthase|nr:flagellar protein export ATPase FliI [bacterium 3DAC]